MFLFGITLLLWNCDNDIENKNKPSIVIKRITFEKLKKKTALKKVISNIEKTNNLKSNNIIANDSTFTIITSDIIETTNIDNITNYSFKIGRPNNDSNNLENFVITQNDNQYSYYILKYNEDATILISSTTVDEDLINQNILDFLTKTEILDDCIQLYHEPCNGIGNDDGHIGTSNCDGSDTVLDFSDCHFIYGNYNTPNYNDNDYGSNNNSNDYGNDNYHASGSSTPNGSVTVNHCKDCMPILSSNDPCDQLNDLTDPDKVNAKQKLENLKTESTTNSGEAGFNFQKDSIGNYSNPDVPLSPTNFVNLKRGGDNYGGAHSHPFSSVFPLFSWADVFVLHNLYKYAKPNVKQEVVMIVAASTTPNPAEIYAIKINDFNAFHSQISQDFQNITASDPKLVGALQVAKIKALDRDLQTKYLSNLDGEKMFLEYFANHNISLYKADSDLDNWSELTLDNTFGTVIETPCN